MHTVINFVYMLCDAYVYLFLHVYVHMSANMCAVHAFVEAIGGNSLHFIY